MTVTGVDEKGKITVTTAGGKTITVADAGRLAVHHTNAPQAAKGAQTKAAAPKATKTASGRNVGEKGAPRGKEKRLGLVDAAIQVMKAAGKPMNCKDIVKAILEKKLWETTGKTPDATLYCSHPAGHPEEGRRGPVQEGRPWAVRAGRLTHSSFRLSGGPDAFPGLLRFNRRGVSFFQSQPSPWTNSAHRCRITSQYSVSNSIRKARRPVCSQPISVEPDPPNRSRTFSPSRLEYWIARTASSTGFSVR